MKFKTKMKKLNENLKFHTKRCMLTPKALHKQLKKDKKFCK